MNFNVNLSNNYILLADTDSLIIGLEPVIKNLYPDLDINDTESILPKVKEIQQELRPILNDYQTVLAKRILNSDEHFFDLKPEFIFRTAYLSGKRRYALHMVDREGMDVDKTVVMGLDITKSNFPPYFKGFGDELIKKILNSTTKVEVDKFVLDFRNSVDGVDHRMLMKPTGIKKIGEYIESQPPKGKIFSSLRKKCPPNTRAAITYNDLIKYNELDQKYSQIQIGDKICLAYLKKNPYNIDLVALKSSDNPQIIEDLVEEYIDKDKMFSTILQEKIQKIYTDIGYGQVVLNSFITDYFNFG